MFFSSRISIKGRVLLNFLLGIIYGGKIVETGGSDLKTAQKYKFGLVLGHF